MHSQIVRLAKSFIAPRVITLEGLHASVQVLMSYEAVSASELLATPRLGASVHFTCSCFLYAL